MYTPYTVPDQVIRVPHNPPSTTNPSSASASPPPGGGFGDEDEDVQMAAAASADEGLKIKPPRKRKAKKVIPVGRNGLKKSRTSFDEKGYMGFLSYFYLVGWLVPRAASMFEFDILLLALCVARIEY